MLKQSGVHNRAGRCRQGWRHTFSVAFIGCLFFFACSGTQQLQASAPIHGEDLQFELLTVGLGEGPEARYGHTLLRVMNLKSGRSINVNWGLFDFNAPGFLLNFFLGKLRYWVGVENDSAVLRAYRDHEKRPVLIERLNLSIQQKEKLWQRVREQLQPEKKYFWYQYFFRNCATFPRDYLDEVLEGRIRAEFSGKSASQSFRTYVRENLNKPPFFAFILDIVMNSRLDQEISQWTEMFYPPKLREYLSQIPATDDNGNPLPDQMLLSEPRKLVDLPDVPSDAWQLHWFFAALSGPLALMFLICLCASPGSRKNPRRGRIFSFLCTGACGGLWGIFSGSLGLIMLISWLFSDHADLHHNANLWLFWPLDFMYILSPQILAKKQNRVGRRVVCFLRQISIAHIAAMICWILLSFTGIIVQDSSRVMIWIAPVAALIFLAIVRGTARKVLVSKGN